MKKAYITTLLFMLLIFAFSTPCRGGWLIYHKPEFRGKITEQEIIEWTKKNMAAYKYPRIIKFVTSLPKSAVGKVLRRVIREKEVKKAEKKRKM